MKSKEIVITALGIALTFVVTGSIAIPVAGLGYINIGDTIIYIFASIVSPFHALLIGGIGSSLSDLVLGYSSYILPTFIIKGLVGLISAYFMKKKVNQQSIISYILGGIIVLVGYAITAMILYSSFQTGLATIAVNSIQVIISIILASFTLRIFHKRNIIQKLKSDFQK